MSESNGHCGIQVVRLELLEALAAQAPVSPSASTNGTTPKSAANNNTSGSTASSNGKYTSRLVVDRWLQDRGIEFRVKPQPDGKNRTVYVLKQCLFDPSHGDPDSCIMQAPDGKMSAQCFHNSCRGRSWQAFKDAIGKPEGHHYDPPLKSGARSRVKIGKGTASAGSSGQTDKPQIVLGPDEYRVNSEAIKALSNPEAAPEVFQRGNILVRVQRTPKAGKQRRIDRAEGTPRIAPMAAPSVCELLTRVADFLKPVENKKGETELVPAHPPDRCVAAVVARGDWPDIRPLEGVLEAPTLRPDWTILVGGASLDAALTGTTWQDRVLGRSKMTPELPLHTVFFATGNNVMLKGDVLRRVLPCRLETKVENPEERENFKYPNLLGHVRANRPQLLCDVLTILRCFAVAGHPEEPLPAFGSYEAWSAVVRQSVFWVMGVDPWSTRRGLRASDPALNTLADLLEGWAELPGGRTGITIAEALRILNNPECGVCNPRGETRLAVDSGWR